MAVPQYSVNPGTQAGSGAYGSVPGLIGLPPNLYSQTSGQFPAVNQGGTNATNFIQSETAGQVAPETQNLLQEKAAAMGVASGSPNMGAGSFSGNNFTESLGLDSQNLAHQGVSDYMSFITGQGSQMTDPNLAFGVAQQNAVDASAPNPSLSAAQLQSNLNAGRSAGGGGVIPFSGVSPAPISSTPTTQGWNDPTNPGIVYGPGGGAGALGGYQYDSSGNLVPTDPASSTSSNIDLTGLTNTDQSSFSPDSYLGDTGLGLDVGMASF